MQDTKIRRIREQTVQRLDTVNVGCFQGMDRPLLLICDKYPGIWLEHLYDSVFYATMDPSKRYLAENAIDLFISNQSADGQFPCFVLNLRDRRRMPECRRTAAGRRRRARHRGRYEL